MKKLLLCLVLLAQPLMEAKEIKDQSMKNKKELSEMQKKVTQEGATEPAFKNEYWDNKKPGIYVDLITGEALFSSIDKFDSGTGWPSFTKTIDEAVTAEKSDTSWGMKRVEVVGKNSGSHLGHVFDDGPKDKGGKRFCINSAALKFIPLEEMKEKGYEKYLSLFDGKISKQYQTAILAGGCFWGVQDIIRKLPGVLKTEVGYIGGKKENPTYIDVKSGTTGYAEAVSIEFDPSKITYSEILEYFFRLHDPTTLNQQGNDVGTQYRSAIFFMDLDQKKIAEQVKEKIEKSGKWKKPLVTQIIPSTKFYRAEDYHQDYLVKHPDGYTCHWLRD